MDKAAYDRDLISSLIVQRRLSTLLSLFIDFVERGRSHKQLNALSVKGVEYLQVHNECSFRAKCNTQKSIILK